MNRTGLSARFFVAASAAIILSGCSFATDALLPIFEDQSSEKSSVNQSPSESNAVMPLPMASQQVNLTRIASSNSGTFVNQKAFQFTSELDQLRGTLTLRNGELDQIRSTTATNAGNYHGLVGSIKSRLQVGTTPGNPQIMNQWRSAQDQLDRIEDDVSDMNQLTAQVAADSAMSAYLLDSVRAAFGLSGAVDDDHRQLRRLEDETNQTTVTIQRLLGELNEDMGRQQEFVANEREKLVELARDINVGQLYVTPQASMSGSPMMPTGTPADFSERRPLVVIRFDRQDVTYEPALYQAISRALDRRPDAVFDLVAVSPGSAKRNLSTGAAKRNAEKVLQSLSRMGLPGERVMLSAMSSASARSSEVHIYIR